VSPVRANFTRPDRAGLNLLSRCGITSTVGLRGGAPHRLTDQYRAAERLRSPGRLTPRHQLDEARTIRPMSTLSRLQRQTAIRTAPVVCIQIAGRDGRSVHSACTKVRRSAVASGLERASNRVRGLAQQLTFSLVRATKSLPDWWSGQDRTVDLPLIRENKEPIVHLAKVRIAVAPHLVDQHHEVLDMTNRPP
jgi:hypothetical protein